MIKNCQQCGHPMHEIGKPIKLSGGITIQWIRCEPCRHFDAVFQASSGQGFPTGGSQMISSSELHLNEIADALGLKIDYEKYLAD